MDKPLAGIKVVEVALYAFVPAAGAVLAEWGADVIKVEHPENPDPMRNIFSYGVNPPGSKGPFVLWEVMNRGKRSVAIDIGNPAGREVLLSLIDEADVFITNFMAPARRKLGIEVEDILARNPRIIYGRGTGHGPRGPIANNGGFDALSYWAMSGASASGMGPEQEFPSLMPGPAFGDIQSGMNLASGVLAALLKRERTGKGSVVDVSLLGSGMWAMAASSAGAYSRGAANIEQLDRKRAPNPIANMYGSGDRRFFIVGALEADRFWPSLCKVIDRPDLVDDPRFNTSPVRRTNCEECIAIFDAAFGALTMAEIKTRMDAQECPWAMINDAIDVVGNPQVDANGYIQMVDHGELGQLPIVAAPAQFDGAAPEITRAPQHGEHTDEVLAALGRSEDELIDLKVAGAIL